MPPAGPGLAPDAVHKPRQPEVVIRPRDSRHMRKENVSAETFTT
jgi:hypothetical protein